MLSQREERDFYYALMWQNGVHYAMMGEHHRIAVALQHIVSTEDGRPEEERYMSAYDAINEAKVFLKKSTVEGQYPQPEFIRDRYNFIHKVFSESEAIQKREREEAWSNWGEKISYFFNFFAGSDSNEAPLSSSVFTETTPLLVGEWEEQSEVEDSEESDESKCSSSP